MSSETTIGEKSSETVETKPEVTKKETTVVEPKFEKSLAEKVVSKFGT
ncbi:MAG: NADH-quinone oxidoreductase subunit C, partial [Thaumarchaeota archaeon]|nr:NADH-quinone oxidoreductase subunit C [Nitrososphaerota archaeon]